MSDRHLALVHALRRSVLETAGALDRTTRQAAADGTLEGDLGDLSRKVRDYPSTVSDADVHRLSKQGHSDDAVFETILAAAFGAAEARLAAAKLALEKKP